MPTSTPQTDSSDQAFEEINSLLIDLRAGDEAATERLVPLVYDRLRSLARRQLRNERSDHTLQATALVHEAWMRVRQTAGTSEIDESSFFAIAARSMRNILVDHARRRRARKRQSDKSTDEVDPAVHAITPPVAHDDMLGLEDALSELELRDAEKVRIIELHFFAGLAMSEVAKIVGSPIHTVRREWQFARSWLQRRLRDARN